MRKTGHGKNHQKNNQNLYKNQTTFIKKIHGLLSFSIGEPDFSNSDRKSLENSIKSEIYSVFWKVFAGFHFFPGYVKFLHKQINHLWQIEYYSF